jgi:hypothetical protein
MVSGEWDRTLAMQEQRAHTRLLRLKSGKIIFNGKQSVMSCQLRDISAKGARLKFVNTMGAPDEFIVDLPGIAEGRWARRVWVRLNEMGIEFFEPIVPAPQVNTLH